MPPRPTPNRRTPRCDGAALAPSPGDDAPAIPLDSAAWTAWLRDPAHPAFAYAGPAGAFTACRDMRGMRAYWYAYRRQNGRLRKVYLGTPAAVTRLRLEAAARALDRQRPGSWRVAAAGRPRTNLPLALTSFVGREQELAAVDRLLTTVRLLTLIGAGGCGKTRLAMEAARQALPTYPDGVWLVELAPLVDSDLLPQTVAAALSVCEQPGQPLVSTLVGALAPRRALVLLDNCEHLLDAAVGLAEALLRGCQALTILATSRAVLGVAGEVAWRVPSLAVPDPAGPAGAPALAAVEAVRLFVERARLARPDFALTEANAATVAAICARLDGLPLAIELAAARVRVLAVEQIAARLDDALALLASGSRAATARHRALRATLDWSHALLDAPERIVFRRLAVFAAGWTLEAAEAVIGGAEFEAAEVLDLLGRLVDQSLVLMEERDGEARYWLLETVRQYALERLRASGEAAATRARHAAACLALVEAVAGDYGGPSHARWLARLESERENWRAALAWAIEVGDRPRALRLTIALYEFWILRGDLAEGRAWLARALALLPAAERTEERAVLLGRLGLAAHFAGDHAAARAHLEEAVAIARELDSSGHLAQVLGDLAITRRRADPAAARRLLEEALAVARRVAGRADAPPLLPHLGLPPGLAARWSDGRRQVALCRHHLGTLAADRGDLAGACAHLAAAAALRLELGDGPPAASSLKELAIVRARDGDVAGARALLERSLAAARAAGWRAVAGDALRELGELALGRDDPVAARAALAEGLAIALALGERSRLATALESGAGLALALAQPGRAAGLLGAAAALRAASGLPALPAEAARAAGRLDAARAALGAAAFGAARAAGEAMTADEAVTVALAGAPRGAARTAAPAPAGLSRREVEVLGLLAGGESNAAIAARLNVSVRTVHGHVAAILDKTGRANRTAAAAFARDHGLV